MSGNAQTLGGVQRKTFTPNVNARRNKKQSADDPLSKLLHADPIAEPVLPVAAPAPYKPPVTKRQSPRLSPRQKPVAAPSPKVARPVAATSSLNPGVIRMPSSLSQRDKQLAADDDGIEGMDLDAPSSMLPPAATPTVDESAWLCAPALPPTLPSPSHPRPSHPPTHPPTRSSTLPAHPTPRFSTSPTGEDTLLTARAAAAQARA